MKKIEKMIRFMASTNLITDLKFKQQVGVKADAQDETLAILNQDIKNFSKLISNHINEQKNFWSLNLLSNFYCRLIPITIECISKKNWDNKNKIKF